MLVALLARLLITALAFAVAEAVLSGLEVSGGFWTYIWIALIFGLVNAVIGTILHLLTLPLTIITFGLFAILVNAVLLEITAALTSKLTIDDFFWTTIWASIIISVVSLVMELIVSAVFDRRRRTV